MSEWQPIETAPKDGKLFLGVSCGNGWTSYNIVMWDWHKNRKTGNFKGPRGVWTPTHWMPVPQPPVQP